MTIHPICLGNRQRGAATLFVTLIMLLVAGLVLLYTSRGAIMEQRLSANEIRSKQAFAAANAGLDYAFGYMGSGGLDQVINATAAAGHDGIVDVITSPPLSLNNSTYSARYCNSAAALPDCPATSSAVPACTAPTDFKDVIVVACGWSDDNTAVHKVTQRITGTPSVPGQMPNPLISKGIAGLTTGGASVFNYFNDLTVWSGDALTSVSNNSKTFVRDTANATYATANTAINTDGDTDSNNIVNGVAQPKPDFRDLDGGTATCGSVTGYTCSTKGGTLGFDAVTGDTQLASYSDDQFFERFLGASPTEFYNSSASYKVDLNSPGTLINPNSTSASSLNGLQAQTVWVAGNLTLPANAVVGTRDNPVILVVDGDFNLSNNFEVNGIVYVRGNITGNGGPTIYGAMVTEGNVNINGNPNIVYDPLSNSSLTHNGVPTKLPGSWKDW